MTKPQKYTPAQIVVALEATKGMVYLAADKLGCEPQTVYNYIHRYASVRAALDKEDGKVTDTAELKLSSAILNGEPWAITFRLKTKGKGRGYVERQEVSETVVELDVSKLSDEQLQRLAQGENPYSVIADARQSRNRATPTATTDEVVS